MKSIEVNYYNKNFEYLVHRNVIEIDRICSNRRFKCLCCGREWNEGINSPSILDAEVEANLYDYYRNAKFCTEQ